MQTLHLRLFATLFCTAIWCGLSSAQSYDGVVFVDDIEQAVQRQSQGPRLPTLGRGGVSDVRSVPREYLEASQQQQRTPEREPSGSSGLFGWLRGDRNNSADPPPTQAGRVMQRDPNVRPTAAQMRSSQANQLPQRNNPRKTDQGLLGKWFGKDDSQRQIDSLPQPTMINGDNSSRGKPTPIGSVASRESGQMPGQRSMPRTMPKPMPLPMKSGSEDMTNEPLQTANTDLGATGSRYNMNRPMPQFDLSDVAWVDDTATDLPPSTEANIKDDGSLDSVPSISTTANSEASAKTVSVDAKPKAVVAPVENPYAVANRPARKPIATQPAAARPSAPREVAIVENPVMPEPTAETPPTPRAASLLVEANSIASSANTEEEFSQVVQMCRHVLAIDSTPIAVKYGKNLASWGLNRRGELKADEGRDDEAMIDFDDALRFDDQCWRAIHNRGVLKAQQGDFAGAFDDFNSTIAINPKFSKAYSNRAALYVQAGGLEESLEDYRQAIVLDPDLAIAHKGRGRVCHLLGKFDMALQHFDAAALLAPTDAFIATSRADLLVDMGRYHQAVEGYKNAIAINANLAASHRSLAWILATCPASECRNAQQALASAERARALTEQDDDLTLDTLAAAKANAGDFTAAMELEKQAIELADESDRIVFQSRLALYENQLPYRTEPASDVQQATYVE